VHLGDDDLPVAAARRVLGDGALVGATCRDPDSARRAEDEGATYVGVGPAYASTTKAGLPDAIGPAGVARVAAAVGIPVIAIGGVTPSRVGLLLDSGAHGVAAAGGVFSRGDPQAATSELVDAIANWTGGSGR
jgi:thiamine-phosphate pyrophosphorylase